MSRARVVLLTAAWTVGYHVVGILNQLATVPLFGRSWGQELYGDWLTLSALVSYLSLADAGMQNYVINRLTQRASREEWAVYRKELASSTLMYVVACSIACVGLALLTLALPLDRWFPHYRAGTTLRLIVALLGMQVIVSLLSGFGYGLYRAIGAADLGLRGIFTQRLLVLGVTVAVLTLRGRAVALALAQLVVMLATTLGFFLDVRRREPRSAITLTGADMHVAGSFIGPSLLFLLISLSFSLTVQGSVLVVSVVTSSAIVAVFSTTRTMANVVRQLIGLVGAALSPEMTRASAGPERARLAILHRVAVKLSCAIVLPCVSVLFFGGPTVYRLWTRGTIEADSSLMRLLLLDQLANTPAYVSATVLLAANKHREIAVIHVLSAVLIVVGSALVLHRFPLASVGAVVALVNFLVFGVYVPRRVQDEVGEPRVEYFVRIYVPLLCCAAISLLATWFAYNVIEGPRLKLIGSTLMAVSVSSLLSWALLFRPDERKVLAGGLQSALRRG